MPADGRPVRLMLIGGLVIAAGVYGGYVELSHPPANLARLLLFAVLLLVGALIMEPRVARALRHGTETYHHFRRGDRGEAPETRGRSTLAALREAGYTLKPRDKVPPGGRA